MLELGYWLLCCLVFFFSSRRRHTRCREVSWARRCVQETGIGMWFDAYFCGSQQFVVLSTSPAASPTHWYQMRFLLPVPIAVNPGQRVKGNLRMIANKEQSFDITITLSIPELNLTSIGHYDLKDPEYRWNFNTKASQVTSSFQFTFLFNNPSKKKKKKKKNTPPSCFFQKIKQTKKKTIKKHV
eukprot:TRINITY_DN9694_c0_g1_i2.p1 TRINITY_DN9694_c0_g1~~TRINITY_DN9694_c0_g1_i2.p1  ORF type:complete len:184 (-),score=53.47 TRINITY_DN9694_c0_g1_i2:123-674(-)